jgi:hypothetical protein
MPSVEEQFVHEATTDANFRRALRDKNRGYLSSALDKIGFTGNKDAVLDLIIQIDWADISTLERRLGDHGVHPDN